MRAIQSQKDFEEAEARNEPGNDDAQNSLKGAQTESDK